MTPGEICNDRGDLCASLLGRGANGVATPNRPAPMPHGNLWVTPTQAAAAEPYGWLPVPGKGKDGLVVVHRPWWRRLLYALKFWAHKPARA